MNFTTFIFLVYDFFVRVPVYMQLLLPVLPLGELRVGGYGAEMVCVKRWNYHSGQWCVLLFVYKYWNSDASIGWAILNKNFRITARLT